MRRARLALFVDGATLCSKQILRSVVVFVVVCFWWWWSSSSLRGDVNRRERYKPDDQSTSRRDRCVCGVVLTRCLPWQADNRRTKTSRPIILVVGGIDELSDAILRYIPVQQATIHSVM